MGMDLINASQEQVFEAMGLTPPAAGQTGGPAGESAGESSGESSGQTGQTAGQGSGQTAGQTAGQSSGQTAGEGSGQTAGQGSGETSGQTAGQSAGQGSGQNAGQSAPGAAPPLTEEQRRDNAARRRQAEQQAAVDRAVQAALAAERQRAEGEMRALIREMGLTGTDGKPIETVEQYRAWKQAADEAKVRRELQSGRLTKEGLDAAIRSSPAAAQIEALARRQAEADARRQAEDRERERREFRSKVDGELEEIRKVNPAVRTVEDILAMPTGQAFREYVRRGNTFADAYWLANREQIRADQAQAALRQAQANAGSKAHLTGTARGRGEGAPSVPADVMRMFRQINPGASDEEIRKAYGRYQQERA